MNKENLSPQPISQIRQELIEAANQPQTARLIIPQKQAAMVFSQPQKEFFQALDENKLFLLMDQKRNQVEINLLHRTLNYLPESISDISRLASDENQRGDQIKRWYQEIYGGIQSQNWQQVSKAYNISAQSLSILDKHQIINLPESFHQFIENIADFQPAKPDQRHKYPQGYISEAKEAQNYLIKLWNILNRQHPAQTQLLQIQGLSPDRALSTLTTEDQYPDF